MSISPYFAINSSEAASDPLFDTLEESRSPTISLFEVDAPRLGTNVEITRRLLG